MLTLQYLLAIAAVCMEIVQSWDIAVSTYDQLNFYTNKTKNDDSVTTLPKDLKALIYDGLYHRLIYAGQEGDFVSIYSYNLTSQNQVALYRKQTDAVIVSLAFDPIKEILFWVEGTKVSRSIYSMPMKFGFKKDPDLLFMTNIDFPCSIAVDSLREYIYWTNSYPNRPTIERIHFNGTEREEIINSTIHNPKSIALDQDTNIIYWIEDTEGAYSIESAELNRNNERNFIYFEGDPAALTISNGSIYWIDNSDNGYIWQLPTKFTNTAIKDKYADLDYELAVCITANNPVMELLSDKHGSIENSVASQDVGVPADAKEEKSNNFPNFCAHGTVDFKNSLPTCKCSPGYIGDRCDLSICHNYCLHGSCSLTDGQPICRCEGSYTGERCDSDPCQSYCLNNGQCSLNDYNDTICLCEKDYEGFRCEILQMDTTNTKASTGKVLKDCASPVCNCSSSGIDCDVCHRYCLNQGICSLSKEGEPICNCADTYEGSRCEVMKTVVTSTTDPVRSKECPVTACNCSSSGIDCDVCHRYCLNQGICSLTKKGEPICHCADTYEGSRCQTMKTVTASTTEPVVSKECPVPACNCSTSSSLKFPIDSPAPSAAEATSMSTNSIRLTLGVFAIVICLM